MTLIVHTRNLTISCFTSTHRQTIKLQIIKQLPNSISERLSKNSANHEIFNTAKVEYTDAVNKLGYNVDLKYANNKSEKRKT